MLKPILLHRLPALLLLLCLSGLPALAGAADSTALASPYVCPMHPQIQGHQGDNCPICGMALEARAPAVAKPSATDQDDETATPVVPVSAAMQNLLGVRLVHVEHGPVAEEVYASGFVEKVAEPRQQVINSKVAGKLVDILVEPGQWVEHDQVLLRIDYPPYTSSLKRYLEAMEQAGMEQGDIDSALQLRAALAAMGASDAVLAGFDQDQELSTMLEIVAPFSGKVSELFVETTPQPLQAGKALLKLSAPALAEVDLRSYSRLARGVKPGHRGRLNVAHLPGQSWSGQVVEVIHNRAGFYSSLRFHVEVPAGVLEPGAFAGAYVDAGTARHVLRVPASALIYGENSARVIVLDDKEQFRAVEVETGFIGHDWVEIRRGLQAGEHVVSRGQFLIDSESSLQAALQRLGAE